MPGTYTVRIELEGKTLSQRLVVAPDPRATFTPADYRAAYAFAKKHLDAFSRLDDALNRLDAYAASAGERAKGASGELAAALAGVRTKALALRARLTADFTNDEDFIQRPGRIREDMQGLLFGAGAPPSAATLDYAARVDGAFDAVMRDVAAFERARRRARERSAQGGREAGARDERREARGRRRHGERRGGRVAGSASFVSRSCRP